MLDAKIPDSPLETMWDDHRFGMKLVNPNNKRKFEVIVVGTGLAGASAAATMAELGYRVKVFTTRRGARTPSPRRAASTPRRTTTATVTRSTACSTTR
jgi:succinate dehydrogenase / fumarate reductase flavoprotein subunit